MGSWAEEINAIGYDIERLDTGVIYSTTNLSYSVENLEPKSTYQFRIRTKYNGFNSPWSNSFNATTSVSKPIVPTIENSTFTHTSISLTWDCVEDAETYEVQVVNTGEIVSTTNTNITFNELLSSTEYNYKIRAKNVVGTSIWSNNYSVTTGIEPPESTILLAESNESNMQNIKWDSVARAEGYEIDCNGIVTIINGGNNTNYLNENLVPNITYNYKIRAFNLSGKSPWSDVLSLTTPDAIVIDKVEYIFTNGKIEIKSGEEIHTGEFDDNGNLTETTITNSN